MKKQIVPVALGLATVWGTDLAWNTSPVRAAIYLQPIDQENLNSQTMIDSEEVSLETMPVEAEVQPMVSNSVNNSARTIALDFEPPPAIAPQSTPVAASPQNFSVAWTESTPSRSVAEPKPLAKSSSAAKNHDLFVGGSESLVARTVGAAEGTRNPDGSKTSLYEGHVDPGNGVWNRGTFSYQFGNKENLSPEDADRRQIAKIKRIYESVMLSKAEQVGVAPLTLAEELNGIDLINQAPLAVTEDGGYIERLAEAKKAKGLQGEAAILEARVWSFWDDEKAGWDAPGLRAYDDISKEASIRHDQKRRMGMIGEALTAYEQQNGAIAHVEPTNVHEKQVAFALPPQPKKPEANRKAEAMADLIISQELPSSATHIAISP